MMKSNVEYGLRGAFKVDTYDGQDNFIETTDWFDNFITQSGLMYPTIYPIADCFRFLTIGTSSATNRGGIGGLKEERNDTTGCYLPISSFTVSDGSTQKGTSIGYQGYETGDGTSKSSCLTRIDGNGIRFYRSWSIPTGVKGITMKEPAGYLNVQEFAVSPGSGENPTGRFAFSRVQRSLPIKNGYRVIINYQLQVNCLNYNLTRLTGALMDINGNFQGGTFLTGNADVTNDYDLIEQWARLSGYYRQVWPGLCCVDYYGATFVPKYGEGMEPYLTDLSDYCIYFSPDNSAFDVNRTGLGFQPTTTSAWASEGVMAPISQTMSLSPSRDFNGWTTEQIDNVFYGVHATETAIPAIETPRNIRLGSALSPLLTPYLANYTKAIKSNYVDSDYNYQQSTSVDAGAESISYATPGLSGLDTVREMDYKQKAIFSTNMYRLPMDMDTSEGHAPNYNAWSGRRKTITRKATFSPAHSLGYNTRFGSMVFAYLADANSDLGDGNALYYPIVDTLFYDTSGQAMTQHYRYVSGIYLTERGSGIASCSLTILPAGTNVQKFVSRRTFQGPINGYVQPPGWILEEYQGHRLGNLLSGRIPEVPTPGDSSYWHVSGLGCSGWGGIIGVTGDDYNSPAAEWWGSVWYDMGIADHNTGSLVEPTGGNPSKLYWPRAYYGKALYVDFHDIIWRKSSDGTLIYDSPNITTEDLTSSGFCRPTGYIMHYDGIGGYGYRLLPNHAKANIEGTNIYYPPTNGGCYPAFSTDNSLEVYMDITWSSDCKGVEAGTCLDPTTNAPNT